MGNTYPLPSFEQVEIFLRKWRNQVAVLEFRQHGEFYLVARASTSRFTFILTVKGVDAQTI